MTEFNNGDCNPYGETKPVELVDDRPVFRWSWKYGFWHVSNGVGPDVLHMLRCKAVSRAKDVSVEEADAYIRGNIYAERQTLPGTTPRRQAHDD